MIRFGIVIRRDLYTIKYVTIKIWEIVKVNSSDSSLFEFISTLVRKIFYYRQKYTISSLMQSIKIFGEKTFSSN